MWRPVGKGGAPHGSMVPHAGEPLNVAKNRNQPNGTMNERIWNIETDKVSVPSLNRNQVSRTR